VNLAGNWAIAAADPRLRALLVQRFSRIQHLNALVAAPLLEEIAVRLFFMSVMAWVISRFTPRAGLVFAFALVGSSCFFALLHLDRPMPDDVMLAYYYRVALLGKYTLAGMPLAWIFWRWGLPYAILCHATVNAVHIALEEVVF
jgi:membrane protease YdiL (CAAX protease family)